MDAETYLTQSVFKSLLDNGWDDEYTVEGRVIATHRDVCVCPDVVTLEERDGIGDEDVLFIYALTGEGSFVRDLAGVSYSTHEIDLMVVAQENDILYRLRKEVERLVLEQDEEGRLELAENPTTGYNDRLRGYTALWNGTMRV